MTKEKLISLLAEWILDNHLSETGNDLKELLIEKLGDEFPVRDCPHCNDVYAAGFVCRICESAVCGDCGTEETAVCNDCLENTDWGALAGEEHE